jgi:hypothetical protein
MSSVTQIFHLQFLNFCLWEEDVLYNEICTVQTKWNSFASIMPTSQHENSGEAGGIWLVIL